HCIRAIYPFPTRRSSDLTVVEQLEQGLGHALTADDVEIETWLLNVAGQSVSAAEISESLASWDVATEQMTDLFNTYDFYITPVSAFTAPKIGELTYTKEEQAELREKIESTEKSKKQEVIYDMFLPSLTYTPFTQLANLTGQPAMSVPIHITDNGLPIGVQAMAQKGNEHRLLRL